MLSVPYLPQDPLLCGSAAAAMVLRYWGSRHDARHFAHLVDPALGGIPTGDLVAAVRDEGWRALPLLATDEAVRRHLRAARPVITLVEVAPDRYHFVVVVAWVDGKVVFHDPAVGPFQVEPQAAFRRRWTAGSGWSLLILPPEEPAHRPRTRPVTPEDRPGPGPSEDASGPLLGPLSGDSGAAPDPLGRRCEALIDRGIGAARSADETTAERQLRTAVATCGGRPEPLRELAGLRFRQERWAEAAARAEEALVLAPDDAYTWKLLGSARFLEGDRDGALAAWNRRGEPRVQSVEIRGAPRTRHPVIDGALGLRVEDLLTREDLGRGRRRLAQLPSMSLTAVRYEPPRDGRSSVVAAVVERPIVPTGALEIGAAVARSLAERRISLPVASPTGGGEVWEPWWRWRGGSSGAGLRVELPAPSGLGGTWSFRVSRAEERFATAGETDGARTHLSLDIADWSSRRTRWNLRSGWDRWESRGAHISLGGGIEQRVADDHLALRLDADGWDQLGPGRGAFATFGGRAAWRSTTAANASSHWIGQAGLRLVVGDPPLDLWPGAGTGDLREPLLRAHALVDDGAIRPDGLGKGLAHATLEYRRRVARLGPVGLLAAAFSDTALTWDPPGVGSIRRHACGARIESTAPGTGDASPCLPGSDSPPHPRWHVDVGAGLRLEIPGRAGSLRLDVARGLRDDATRFSAAWDLAWPGWDR